MKKFLAAGLIVSALFTVGCNTHKEAHQKESQQKIQQQKAIQACSQGMEDLRTMIADNFGRTFNAGFSMASGLPNTKLGITPQDKKYIKEHFIRAKVTYAEFDQSNSSKVHCAAVVKVDPSQVLNLPSVKEIAAALGIEQQLKEQIRQLGEDNKPTYETITYDVIKIGQDVYSIDKDTIKEIAISEERAKKLFNDTKAN